MMLRRCLIALSFASLAGAAFAAAVMPFRTPPDAALSASAWHAWCHVEAKPWVGADLCSALGGAR